MDTHPHLPHRASSPLPAHSVAQEGLLDLLLAATNDGIMDWDLVNDGVWYSERWKMMLGYEVAALPDTPDLWRRLSHPDDLERVEDQLREHVENPWPFSATWRMRHANGDWRWLMGRAATVRNSAGRATRLLAIFTDVTDQVLAEERHRALATALPDAMVRLRRDGVVLDQKAGEGMDLIPLGLTGRSLMEAHPGAWAERAVRAVQTSVQLGNLVMYEDEGIGPGVWCEVRVVRSGENEAVCIFRDITERKRAERSLRESLESLRRAQSALVETSHRAGMADVATSVLHDIGNLLNSVNTSAGVSRDLVAEQRTDVIGRCADLMRAHKDDPAFLASPKGAKLIEYLSELQRVLAQHRTDVTEELARLQRNVDNIRATLQRQQTLARHTGVAEETQVDALVEDALSLCELAGNRSKVEVERTFESVATVTERHRLLRILVNLLDNARRAVAGVPKPKIAVGVAAVGDTVIVEVRDTGCGIAPENLSRIFQQGFTTRAEGHGFGLHGSANAATALGGRLTAHSAGLGQGATFQLVLPLRTPAVAK